MFNFYSQINFCSHFSYKHTYLYLFSESAIPCLGLSSELNRKSCVEGLQNHWDSIQVLVTNSSHARNYVKLTLFCRLIKYKYILELISIFIIIFRTSEFYLSTVFSPRQLISGKNFGTFLGHYFGQFFGQLLKEFL